MFLQSGEWLAGARVQKEIRVHTVEEACSLRGVVLSSRGLHMDQFLGWDDLIGDSPAVWVCFHRVPGADGVSQVAESAVRQIAARVGRHHHQAFRLHALLDGGERVGVDDEACLLYTSPSPRDS